MVSGVVFPYAGQMHFGYISVGGGTLTQHSLMAERDGWIVSHYRRLSHILSACARCSGRIVCGLYICIHMNMDMFVSDSYM